MLTRTALIAVIALSLAGQALAGPIALDDSVSEVFSNEDLAVLVDVEHPGPGDLSIASWHVAVEVAGAFYFLPGYDLAATPLASKFTLPAGTSVQGIELARLSFGVIASDVPLTWYCASLDASGGLIGALSEWPVLLKADSATPTPLATPHSTTWTRVLGGSGDDLARSVAVDGAGDVVVVGVTGGPLFEGQSVSGGSDLFLTKHGGDGTPQWTRLLGGTGDDFDDYAGGVAVDGVGNIYVAGSTESPLFDGQNVSGSSDLFLTKFDSGGTQQWTRLLGGMGGEFDGRIAVDGAGNVTVAGHTTSSMLEGQAANGDDNTFVARYDANGTKRWIKVFEHHRDWYSLEGIALDRVGSVYIASTVTEIDYTYQNPPRSRPSLTKLDSNGSLVSLPSFSILPVLVEGFPRGVTLDADGNIFLTGSTDGDPHPFSGVQGFGEDDMFLVKYDSSMTLQWRTWLGGSESDRGSGVAVDGAGNVYVTGYTISDAFDGLSTAGTFDMFLVKYAGDGAKQWTRVLGSSGWDAGEGVAVDSAGNVYVTGETDSWPAFNGQATQWGDDMFLMKFLPDGTHSSP